MEEKRITCPQCHAALKVKNSKNEEYKQITCPRCHTQLRVHFPRSAQQSAGNGGGGGAFNDGRTRLPYGGLFPMGPQQPQGPQPHSRQLRPVLIVNGQNYSLRMGQNIIGRQSPASAATIQIPTTDRTMSRAHSLVNVTLLPNGALHTELQNFKNINDTMVNGQLVGKSDTVVLTAGSQIRMGATTLTYQEI